MIVRGWAMSQDHLTDEELRAVVVDSLRTQPGATLTQIETRLHARTGRPLEQAELQRLDQIYHDEGYAAGASASLSDDATRAATSANLMHARPTGKEIVDLIAAIVPLFFHFQSSTGARVG